MKFSLRQLKKIFVNNFIRRKTSKEYMNEITNLVKNYDVNTLKYGSEYIWPYLRNRLWIQLYGLGNGNISKADLPPTAIQRGSSRDLPYKARVKIKKQYYYAKEIHEIPERYQNIDFLFVTVINAAEQVELDNGKIYHRITDPVYEIAKNIGRTRKIEILRVKSKALEKSKTYYYPVLYIMTPYIYKCGYSTRIKFGKLLSFMKKNIPSIVHSGAKLRESIDWELHTRDFYIDVLKKINPKVIFLNGFHFQAPLISAADFLGIKTVDLQHGIQVGWNTLYNDWREMPKEGYQALPDYFFVWGKKEKESIEKVFKGKKHNAVITGNPWLSRQAELTKEIKTEYLNKFSNYKVITLLILQKQNKVPSIYKELIEKSSKDNLWIVRHHPKGNRFKENDFVSSCKNKNNILIDHYIDSLPLVQLFKHINVVISEGSTVAAEADYYGLYNFIFGKKGKGNYINEIKRGEFFYLEKVDDYYSKIKGLDFNKKTPRANLFEKVNIENILKDLL